VSVAIGTLVLPIGLVATGLRVFPPHDDLPALLASFIPYGTVAYAVSLVMFGIALLRARRRAVLGMLTGIVAVLLGVHLGWLAPFFVADRRPTVTTPFTVMSLNLKGEQASPEQVVAHTRLADIVVLLEVTPAAVRGLRAAGIGDTLHFDAGSPPAGSTGSMIYSRFALHDAEPLPPTSFQQWSATADVPQIGSIRIIAAHPCNPFCGPGRWPAEQLVLQQAVAARLGGPLVVAGDFNAVDDHGAIRALNTIGLKSATDVAGAGWLPTYPANTWLPPLICIDHVMVDSQLTATAVNRFRVDGTDHLGLLATLAGTS
jgi:endonuclease/exonuclease/phosphatase (EEP) superfamily protein YafD